MQRTTRVGLALALACGAVPAVSAQVVNGGFETGDLTGWTQHGNLGFNGVTGVPFNHTGSFGSYHGEVGSTGGIFQTIATTPGASYNFLFWLTNFSSLGTNSFDASWDGGSVQSYSNATAFGYTQFLVPVVATSALTDIRFTFRHDPSFWGLDDVSVQLVEAPIEGGVVPEPASMVLMASGLVGLAGLGAVRRRRGKPTP